MKKLVGLLIIICFIGTSIVTIATSKKGDDSPLTFNNYGAASNCANATVTNQLITVSSTGFITAPNTIDFTALGLPAASVAIATQTTVSGSMGGFFRSCVYSLNNSGGTLHIYSCSDNGMASCQVSFTPM